MGSISFVLGAVLRGLRGSGPGAAVAVLLSALTVLVAGGTIAGRTALGRLTEGWRSDLRLVATLEGPRPRAETAPGVVDAIRALPGVAAVRYVSPDDALAELERYLRQNGAQSGEGLARLPSNPVPARLRITPAASLDAAGLRRLVTTVQGFSGVDEVSAALDWVAEAERVDRGLRGGGFALASLLALGALGAVAVVTGAGRRARAGEIAILRLCGVGLARLWSPLLIQGLLPAVLGAALGVGALWLASEAGPPWVDGWLRTVAGLPSLPVLPGAQLGALVGAGALLGLLGGLAGGRP